ncbi:MAG TPA: beta-galactosidase GalA [Bacteroidales bacterium]|nr:beta-galactosidase GalA [Bacteroidales bacterium]HOK99241.1 beta-galactosidase GalA [Bacteroidales bacterium]HPO66146.1 beta-galactosidase GalA [Bacteroidales bacterium]
MKARLLFLIFTFLCSTIVAKDREVVLMDHDWLFALGHATDVAKDFHHRTAYFSYFAKAGYGDGAAAPQFDDRSWQRIDVPHDWCVTLPFTPQGGHSHGYRAIGINFPENSIGWYRKHFYIPTSDFGRKVFIHFEGVHRDAQVWVNGFYCGRNHSGYYGFEYDITDYLNYGGNNVIAVRVDASMEEGWYYEGAGIYRHVWLIKTSPLHIARYGTFVVSRLIDENKKAQLRIGTTLQNDNHRPTSFDLMEQILDAQGNIIAQRRQQHLTLLGGESREWISEFEIKNPQLWSLENPYLHKLVTQVYQNDTLIDSYTTSFGIRSIRFSPDSGFFLNGKHVILKGTNNHQDHAGVGTAIPDALQEYRIKILKSMGSNAIRTSHNPPSPALLDACDRLGMLVLDENRLMGSNEEHLRYLRDMILRDRNHPSVILWSLGNEEWGIECNEKGPRIGITMQEFGSRIDSTRPFTTACSGCWDTGTGTILQVMGYNYIKHGNIDEHHRLFPWQPAVGTEESNTIGTRGIYVDDEENGRIGPRSLGTEIGWKYYSQRPFLAGLFYWTGFDYRGEPNPLKWPAVSSQYGIVDLCGFPKDIFYYLKSWWTQDPVLHIAPHWNGIGQDSINVTVYSNCEQVELFLNGKSLGKKSMEKNGHLSWLVKYRPGKLEAVGYTGKQPIIRQKIETTENPTQIKIITDKTVLRNDRQDVTVINITTVDSKGRVVPTAQNDIYFSIEGPVRIIGVGNGDPASHEPEQFLESFQRISIDKLKEATIPSLSDTSLTFFEIDDSDWKRAFSVIHKDWRTYTDTLLTLRGEFILPEFNENTRITLFSKSILENQTIFVNGHRIATNIQRDAPGQSFVLNHDILKQGRNVVAFVGQRFRKKHLYDEPNTDPGLIQVWNPAPQWHRKLFNGWAQVILQSTDQPGEAILRCTTQGLKGAEIKLRIEP